MSKSKKKYYDVRELIELGNKDNQIGWFIAFGKRAAGKSYSTALYILETYLKTGATSVIVRRLEEEIKPATAGSYFSVLVNYGVISDLTDGKYDRVVYYSRQYYLAKYDEEKDKIIRAKEPFCFATSIDGVGKTKMSNYPTVGAVILEEFLAIDGRYLGPENTEFNLFLNLLSTIIRDRTNVKIILLGNTVSRYNPYFTCLGIEEQVMKMKVGDRILVNNHSGKLGLKIAIDYTPPGTGQDMNPLLDFTTSEASNMINTGDWQMYEFYPHLPEGTRIRPKDVIYTFFMIFHGHILQGDVILQDNKYFLFFHKKTTEIRDPDKALIYDLNYHLEHNYRRDLLHPIDDLDAKVLSFFKTDRVYCQDAFIGEQVHQYLMSLV